ncbi:MAG: glycosyltransferase [Bryobacteraceae bacterium]|jgi:ceramide glucosyltransferase
MAAAAWILLALVAGATVYAALVVAAACSYLFRPKPALVHPEPISVLKPLAGLDEGLEENLRSFFRQDYPEFELLFAVRDASDPAVAVVDKLRAEFPHVPARLVLTGEPSWVNPKCYSLDRMLAQARYELIVMSDSDTRVGPDLLATLAAEFGDPGLGLASCPYRAVGGRDFWSCLEAIGLNTEMLAGVLADRILEGVKFGLGPVMGARRKAIEAAGGFAQFQNYLTEDFLIGRRIAERGFRTILSSCVIEHRLGTQGWRENLAHRLRWMRGGRRMRPAGYLGQLFTYALPPALALWAVRPGWWPVAVAALAVRLASAWASAVLVVRDGSILRRPWLLPVQDVLGFSLWIAGFFGNTVTWRGRRYVLNPDGTFRPAAGASSPVGG